MKLFCHISAPEWFLPHHRAMFNVLCISESYLGLTAKIYEVVWYYAVHISTIAERWCKR